MTKRYMDKRPGDKLRKCPICGKDIQERGFSGHVRFAHGDTKETRELLARKSAKTLAREALDRARVEEDVRGASGSKPKLARLGRTKPIVYRVSREDAVDEDRDGGFPCPKCGVSLELPDIPDGKGEEFELSCPDCQAVIELVTEEEETDEEETDEEETDEEEADEEEAEIEKTDGEKEADRLAAQYREIKGLLDSLRPCRNELSLLGYGFAKFFGDLPFCWKLYEELERVSKGEAGLSDERFEELRDWTVRFVRIKKAISGLEASGADENNEARKKYCAEVEAIGAEFDAAVEKSKAEKEKAAGKGSASSGWL